MNPPYKKIFNAVLSGFFILTIMSCKSDEITLEPEPEPDPTISYIDLACSSCDFVIPASEWRFDGIEMGVIEGDTIGIPGGNRAGLLIENVIGTEENPVVIINCDGRAELGNDPFNSVGINILNSKHFVLAGVGSTDEELKYGFGLIGYKGLEIAYKSTNFEVFAVEVIKAGYAGIMARSDATCDGEVSKSTFTQYNTILHDNYVHDTGGEGFYVGGSHWGAGQREQYGCVGTLLFEPELEMVRIYNNRVINTGLDGIQVGSASKDCKIYNNYIENFGLTSSEGHMTGFQINPGTTGELYNNVINKGNGFGIFMAGRGDNVVYNNLIIEASYDGIIAIDAHPTEGLGFSYINNTIIKPGGYGYVSITYNTSNNVLYNNIITNPGKGSFNGPNYEESDNLLTTDQATVLFVDPANLDFSLQPSSPAIDAGRDVSSFGIDIDFLGNDRPIGDYDIGAYEFQ